jgi:hypothetical protein
MWPVLRPESLLHSRAKKCEYAVETCQFSTSKEHKIFFRQERLWSAFSGIQRESFTWTFSLVKNPSTRSIIQLFWLKCEARNSLKWKKTAGFTLPPLTRQRSSSHHRFNTGGYTETEVGCTASSTVYSWFSSVRLPFVWTTEWVFRQQEIPRL